MERVKDRASRIHNSRIGSALVCVRRNAQHRELKLPKVSAICTAVMVAISLNEPTGCQVSPPPLSSQIIELHEKSSTSHRARNEPHAMRHALGENREGKERVKG